VSYGLGVVHTNESNYRKEWATLTGRSEREIYVPLALRTTPAPQPPTPRPADRPTGPGKDKPQPPW
jgi:hypothetical protein